MFYEAPPSIVRYFDPYAGTGTGVQSLMDAFDFGSMSPGINFLLMPASYDILKVQAIEFNDQIRRSAYSFELVNNRLKLFPVPKRATKTLFPESRGPIINKLCFQKELIPETDAANQLPK